MMRRGPSADLIDALRAAIDAERMIDPARGLARFRLYLVRAILRAQRQGFRTIPDGKRVYVGVLNSGELTSWCEL